MCVCVLISMCRRDNRHGYIVVVVESKGIKLGGYKSKQKLNAFNEKKNKTKKYLNYNTHTN